MASTSASSPLGGKAAAGQGLFTRQSSGLVRELGVPAATGIALASVAVVNTFINFNAGLVSFNQADMTLPLLLGAAIWLVAMFAYKYLLEAIPRAGGEYVYLSRIISPALGAMAGISICIAFTYILAANANFTATYTPFMLTALGAAFNSSAISDAAGNVTFFFQAEDGIRDLIVTGVQTCALPICATGTLTDPVTAAGVFDPAQGAAAVTNVIAACQAALAVGGVGSAAAGHLTHLSASLDRKSVV